MKPVQIKWKPTVTLIFAIFVTILFIFNYRHNGVSFYKQHDKYLLSAENQFNSEGIRPVFQDMVGKRIPNVVFYVWCHNRTIHFVNYLSVMSSWKMMKPDIIEFHTLHYPIPRDQDKYNYWLEDLEKTIPSFVVLPLPDYITEKQCGVQFGKDLLMDRGGIYVNENTILLQPLGTLRANDFEFGTTGVGTSINFIMSTSKNRQKLNQIGDLASHGQFRMCGKANQSLNLVNEKSLCAQLVEIYPRDIMYTDTLLASLLRYINYNKTDIVQPSLKENSYIPKVVHYVWFNRKNMTFSMYLSLKSTLNILQPEKVYIHGDGYLEGDLLKRFENDSRVEKVFREQPHYVFGKKVIYTQHKSDIIRADILSKYGGIYMDWDAFWVQPIDDLLQSSCDALVNFDHTPYSDFPDAINLGVFISKPGSTFVNKWQEALINYRSLDFFYNAILLPYKIYEKYPYDVCIEKHLQVMCFHGKCRPTFKPNYKQMEHAEMFDWRTEAYSIHITYPDPPEFDSEENLRNSTSMFGEIGKFILDHK